MTPQGLDPRGVNAEWAANSVSHRDRRVWNVLQRAGRPGWLTSQSALTLADPAVELDRLAELLGEDRAAAGRAGMGGSTEW